MSLSWLTCRDGFWYCVMVDKLDGSAAEQWSEHDDFWMAECIKDSILSGRITSPEQIDQ